MRRRGAAYTIHDIATMAGVSSITASRYFNQPQLVSQKLRERIDQVLRDTGYVPSQIARRLASTQGGPVGAVMQNVSSPTFAEMVKGMTQALEERQLQLLLANSAYSQDAEERAVRTFAGWYPSGMILTRADHLASTSTLLMTMHVPIVEAWEITDGSPFHQVGFRQSDVGAMLARHFIEQGARRIRFAQTGLATDGRSERRAMAYVSEMKNARLTPEIVKVPDIDEYAAGISHVRRVSESPRELWPEAIIFANDQMALAAMLQGPSLGLHIPSDCAIAGFGDAPLSSIVLPEVTSVKTHPYEIGKQAAEVLVSEMSEPRALEAEPIVRNIPCQLVVRASSILNRR
jgi:LacI family gluconate utilization system Gnt-I transcriptional repressor